MDKIKFWRFPAILLLILGLLFSGCSSKTTVVTEEPGTYRIYYKDIPQTGLGYRFYQAAAQTRDDLVQELWAETIRIENDSKQSCIVPDGVILLKTVFETNNLSFYFNAAAGEMDTVSQLLFRTAIVRTFCSIDGVETVTFFADDSPLTGSDLTPLGAQSNADYVDVIGRGLSSTSRLTLVLYYADQSGDQLVTTTKEILYTNTYSLENDIVTRLKKSDEDNGCYATLPESVSVISSNVKDGTCYINFSSSFVSDALPISGSIIIYSVVNSLSELPDVENVQIMVEGSSVVFKDNIDLSSPLTRNLNY